MERRLYIIRHGKSSWDHEGLQDQDRPLADRGTRDAYAIAKRLKEEGRIPRLLFSSPAARALQTALIMSRVWELSPEALQIHDSLYEAYGEDIDQVVARAPAEVTDLAIFGHNPTFTLYANRFLDEPLDNLPTAGVVVLTFDTAGWSHIKNAGVVGSHVDYPKRKL
jgi:phosphohistidine phosphatase